MKIALSLCLLAILASASADCGCLKCNPQLQVVSPRYSPCKVIYRNSIKNLPSTSPYKLQAAVAPPPPLFIPKEYDYKMQYLPYARPYTGSVYEYGLQAAVVPAPVHVPLNNLRTGVERVVMDAPALMFGSSNCNTGLPRNAPLPTLPVLGRVQNGCNTCGRDSCGCNSCGCNSCGCNPCNCDSKRRSPYGFDTYQVDTSDYDECSNDRLSGLSGNEDAEEYKGPIIERYVGPICGRI